MNNIVGTLCKKRWININQKSNKDNFEPYLNRRVLNLIKNLGEFGW